MALLRAVDKFNVERGFKFSTYACRAILKSVQPDVAQIQPVQDAVPGRVRAGLREVGLDRPRKRDAVQEDCVDELKQIVDRNLAELSDVEQTVIRRRFNWEQTR